MSKKKILDQSKIAQIVRRMAHQIYENNFGTKEIVFVGIGKQGSKMSELIADELKGIDKKLRLSFSSLTLDKENPAGTVRFLGEDPELSGRCVVLVDDVLNTGKTTTYCLTSLLDNDPEKIEIAVLVDRGHKSFPVTATYSGYQLSTTLEEHIEVKLGKESVVYLY